MKTHHKFAQRREIPENRDLEQAVLGGLMLDTHAIKNAFGINVQCFHQEDHRLIFLSIQDLYNKQLKIDMLTVMEHLKSSGNLAIIGGPAYLASLTNKVASTSNIEYHTRILIQYSVRRQIINESDKSMSRAFDMTYDPLQLVQETEQGIFSIGSVFHSKKIYDAGQVGKMMMDHFDHTLDLNPDSTTGIPSGIIELDKLMNGLQPGDLGVIAARPGMGKTALTLNMARHMSISENKPGAIFSLEMTAIQLGQRVTAIDSGIPTNVLRDGRKATKQQLEQVGEAIGRFSNAPIWIDDTPGPNIHEIRSKARLLKSKYDIKYIIIDYLQLMSPTNYSMNMDIAIGEMSRGLKEMAKELDIPVISLSQLNRAVESRSNRIPNLGDLRSSGNIEQDADWIAFIFRPAYYDISVDDDGTDIPDGLTKIIVAKNRHGELKNIPLIFKGDTTRFSSLQDDDFPTEEDEPAVGLPVVTTEEELPF